MRRSALRAVRRETAVTVESAWCSAFAVRVDGSRRSAASARRCTSARVSGRAMASNSHIRRRLEKNAHMLRVPSFVPARFPALPALPRAKHVPSRLLLHLHVVTRRLRIAPAATTACHPLNKRGPSVFKGYGG